MQNNVLQLPASYYTRLGSSIEEKLFFLSRIPSEVTVFADFGCGDGKLLAAINERRVGTQFTLGYDRNAKALPEALDCYEQFTSSLDLFKVAIMRQQRLGRKVCLILSSVIHELLSQGIGWGSIWNMVRDLNPDYIVIRDMACTNEAKRQPAGLMANTMLNVDDRFTDIALYGTNGTFEFQSHADFLQALLKYRYTENIRAEIEEDYFSLTSEQWHNIVTIGSGYKLHHFDHHSVPWHRENWKRDFGLDIEDPTHIKIILKKA